QNRSAGLVPHRSFCDLAKGARHVCDQSLLLAVFFFSSRRRHTSWPRDWSSDVCSSDLDTPPPVEFRQLRQRAASFGERRSRGVEIGRASRRERVARLAAPIPFIKFTTHTLQEE